MEKNQDDMASQLLKARVQNVLGQFESTDEKENCETLQRLIRSVATHDGKTVPFEQFEEYLSGEIAGLVLTAHPTFALSERARNYANALLSDDRLIEDSNAVYDGGVVHPKRSPTLDEELAQSETAVLHIRRAIRTVYSVALDVATETYPNDYRKFSPGFVTVATWVGFDLDGRTDIGWSKSLQFRYRLALLGLSELSSLIEEMCSTQNTTDKPSSATFAADLDLIQSSLATLQRCFELGMRGLDKIEQGDVDLALLNSLAIENRERKQSAMTLIDDALERMINSDQAVEWVKSLLVFRAEWSALGLGASHIHFRLNAVQLHNAIRSEIKLDRAPDKSASRRYYLNEISKLLTSVEPVNVHYGTLEAEQTTAKRLFMLAAQFEKHFDGRTPIRLLVAESDTPFTLLTALYYARLFKVADHVEISPLFETAIGLKRGDRVIAELLDNEHFLDYVRSQKRFAIQLGFSDSGRYIGQVAANLAIERFKLRVIQLWTDSGLSDVQLLFFDTHGESIGRGAHPDSLRDRFLTIHTPRVRGELNKLTVHHKHEASFQGGDGFLWFANEGLALATLTHFLQVRIDGDRQDAGAGDAFYDESDWSLDFFLTVREFQERLSRQPGYVALLDSLAPSLLFATGSRASRRQGRLATAKKLESIDQIRAIPNNAMLQQLGFVANVLGGVGAAIHLSPERFDEIHARSPRLQRLMRLVLGAQSRSSISFLVAYANLLNPNYWLEREEQGPVADRSCVRLLSSVLETAFDHEAIGTVVRVLRRDAEVLNEYIPVTQCAELAELHRSRINEIEFIFLTAMSVPRFSSRLDVSLDELIVRLLRLEVPVALDELRSIFPAEQNALDDRDYGEDSPYMNMVGGYIQEHEEIFDPIERAYERILELSALIALKTGSYG